MGCLRHCGAVGRNHRTAGGKRRISGTNRRAADARAGSGGTSEVVPQVCYNGRRMLENFTVESFQPLVGTSFFAVFPNGAKVELRLASAKKVMESEVARLARHPFSLYFAGPLSFMLKQGTYTIEHETFAQPVELFIVPVGRESDVYNYEAVFT